jgi:hypothetical protein
MTKANKLILKAKDNFPEFISKLEDLTKIEDIVKLKIDSENILMYSLVGDTSIVAFKSHILNTIDYFDVNEFDFTLDLIINGAKRFVKNLKFYTTNVKIEIPYKESPESEDIMHARAAQFNNGKLKVSCIGAEQFKVRDIPKNALAQKLDPKNSKWMFKVNSLDFSDIKKLASNSEDTILNIGVNDGQVTFSEASKWELDVDKVEKQSASLTFSKKYLSNINCDSDFVEFKVFDSFILISEGDSNLMIVFEMDFSNED